MAPGTYDGSCHCGSVKYTTTLDLSAGTVRCNCTICSKTRSWEIFSQPQDFSITQGSSELTNYTFNSHTFPHYFCKRCGVQVYMTGTIPGLGERVMVQVQTLDRVEARELEKLVEGIQFIDNLNDAPTNIPEHTKHL